MEEKGKVGEINDVKRRTLLGGEALFPPCRYFSTNLTSLPLPAFPSLNPSMSHFALARLHISHTAIVITFKKQMICESGQVLTEMGVFYSL